MRRREVIALLGGAAVAWPRAAGAQQTTRLPRVGYLFSFTPAEGQHLWEACRLGLRDLGYVEGGNIVLEPRWADGHHDRLPTLIAELVALKVDVIVAAATPASRAAKAATSTIPIVIVAVGEPVRAGLVASLARPGGNVTGLSLLTPELSGKRLELLKTALGTVSRVALLMNPENAVSAVFLEETRAAASQLGIAVRALEARNAGEIERAFQAAKAAQADALIVFDDPVLWSHRGRIVALAAALQIPAMYGYRDFVEEGGLMSYGPDRPDHYRRTAGYVDKILKGTNPGDLPIEQPTKFELVMNLKTASALGLTIPPTLLARADQVIE
jgi:putative tryptophan/tyrosine transport system substrate-binding protein